MTTGYVNFDNKTIYLVYARQTPRHKWRLQSTVLDAELALAQADGLLAQAQQNGYAGWETIAVWVNSAGQIAESLSDTELYRYPTV